MRLRRDSADVAIGFTCALALVSWAALASPSTAQDLRWTLGSPTAGLPGDTEGLGQYDLSDAPGVELDEVGEAELDLARLDAAPRSSLDGFDTRRYPLAAIDAYFDRVLADDEIRDDEPSDFTAGTLRLVIRTRAADGTVRWWRLAGDSRHLTIAFKTPADPDSAERLAAATSDPGRPVVDVQYSSIELHASSASDTRHHLLLDFRSATPRVIGFFDETGGGCGGACSVYGCIFGVGEEIGCRWDAEHDGFFCAHTYRRRDTAWMERRATSYFHFGTSAPDPPAHPAAARGGLDPRVDRALTPSEGSAKIVDGFGIVTSLALAGVGTRAVVLVGAPSMSWHFGARFFAALTDHPWRGPLIEIGTRLDVRVQPFAHGGNVVERLEDHDYLKEHMAAFTPDGAPPRFVATELARNGSVTILRVLVTEGGGKGVYLVGLELIGDRLVTDAMLVATNGESHLECNIWRVPATAVGMSVAPDPFAVTLDVEPADIRTEGPSEAEDDLRLLRPARSCRVRATVAWEPGQGFRYAAREERCEPAAARRVAIDDAGGIAVAPPSGRPPL
jgi:hypothetical protein